MQCEAVMATLRELSKFDIPEQVERTIADTIGRYGLIQLHPHPEDSAEYLRVTFAMANVTRRYSAESSGCGCS